MVILVGGCEVSFVLRMGGLSTATDYKVACETGVGATFVSSPIAVK